MKKILLFLLIIFTNCFAFAQDSTFNFTLEDCINYATNNNYQRQNSQLNKENAEISLQQAKNQRLPSVSGSASESLSHTGTNSDVNFSGNIGVNAQVNIYSGGSVKNNIKNSELQSQRADFQLSQLDDNLKIQILSQFLTALSNQEKLKYQESILNASREQFDQAKHKYSLGAMIESDYLMLESQLTGNICDSLDTYINMENAIVRLKQIISMSLTSNLNIIEPDTSLIPSLALLPELEDAISMAKNHMPDILLAKSTIEIAQTSIEIAKSGHRPSLSASASVNTGHNNFEDFGDQLKNRFSQSIGLNLSVPIFDRMATKSQIAKSNIQLKQAELDYMQTQLDIEQTLVNQYNTVSLGYQRYLVYQQRKDAYYKSYLAYKLRFDLGMITTVELLQRQNEYINALNQYIQAKYGFILNRKILDVYMGQEI